MKQIKQVHWLLIRLATLITVLALSTPARADVSPPTASFTLRAGDPILGVATETKTVDIPAVPRKADIEIAIDTTFSMDRSINQAKADATNIVNGVQGLVPDSQFAVVQFRDPDCTPEYQLLQAMTPNATDIQTAINNIHVGASGCGGDFPEAHNLVFDKSSDAGTGWRTGSRKFVVVISDAQPHGELKTEGFTGCINESADTTDTDGIGDPHGLSSKTELAQMAAAKRTLLMIRQVDPQQTSTTLLCYQSLAAAGFIGGQAVDAGGSLSTQIVNLIEAAFAEVNNLHLQVMLSNPNASWITFNPVSVGPVPAPSTQTFTLTVTVPAGTPAGTYNFKIMAVADGIGIGSQDLEIIVPQKQLTLDPASASNPIGTTHTVTATVFDVLGPFVGDTVSFSVTAGPDAGQSGTGTTDSNGTATFTISNTPPTPGTDIIVATNGLLSASATKEWVNLAPDCSKVALNRTTLWPPNHKMVWITASGAFDSDIGDSATLVIDRVSQDERVNNKGDGNTAPDARLTSPLSNQAQVRAERSGIQDGRVYRLHFTATDTHGATCDGYRRVGVPHDRGRHSSPVDSAPPSYNSLVP